MAFLPQLAAYIITREDRDRNFKFVLTFVRFVWVKIGFLFLAEHSNSLRTRMTTSISSEAFEEKNRKLKNER